MTLPLDNLDDKNFEDLVKDAISRIPIYAPDWTDHNRSDPGIAFIELFSWLVEMQIYRLNKINDKTYLKFLKLLGINKLEPAKPAQVDVTFSLKDKHQSSQPVPIGTKIAAIGFSEGEDIIFETKDYLEVLNISLDKILSSEDSKINPDNKVYLKNNTASNAYDNIYYYPFGQNPTKNSALYLGFKVNDNLGGKRLSLMVYLQKEPTRPEANSDFRTYSSKLVWEYYSNLYKSWRGLNIQDKTDNLTYSGPVEFTLPEDKDISSLLPGEIKNRLSEDEVASDYQLFWIKCYVSDQSYEIPPVINSIIPNTVGAVHGSRTEARFSSDGLPNLILNLNKPPVRIIKIAINSDVKYTEWTQVQDFDSSGPSDQSYVLDSVSGTIAFGDGIRGALPPKGDKNISITYISGAGPMGNVGAHSINKIIDESSDIESNGSKLSEVLMVENRGPASGGKPAETLDEAIGRARRDLRSITRAVTDSDYEYLAMNTPSINIKRAKALPLYHPLHERPIFNTMTVIAVPATSSAKPDITPSQGFLKTVHSFLDNYRLLTTDLFVISPKYIRVMVKSTVVCKDNVSTSISSLEKAIIGRLNKFLHPVEGGSKGNGWPFGRPVYLSEIYEIISRIEGVDFVKDVQLSENGGDWKAANVYIPKHALVFSGQDEDNGIKDQNARNIHQIKMVQAGSEGF